ncbi:MAG: hypothetical protein ACRDF5_10615 [bacterium]
MAARLGSAAGRRAAVDVLAVVLLAAAAFSGSLYGAGRIHPIILHPEGANIWFEADPRIIFGNMTDRGSDHFRTGRHPLFSLLTYPLVKVLSLALGSPEMGSRIFVAGVAALWLGALFAVLRAMGCARGDALLFALLAGTSAGAVFWLVLPETFALASASLLAPLGIAALASRRRVSPVFYVGASAISLSVTVTNWMAGLAATVVAVPWRRALRLSISALALVVLLWGVQKAIFPSAQFFFGAGGERRYLLRPEAGGPATALKSFLFHTMVMPAISAIERGDRSPSLSTQFSWPGSGSLWAAAAVVCWSALLALGLWGMVRTTGHRPLRFTLAATLAGQALLHAFFGPETFLYALNLVPLLVLVAAFATLTPARPAALLLAGATVALGGFNNVMRFQESGNFVGEQVRPRYLVLTAMRERPDDLWPRSAGHVILAQPGSAEGEKAYHEPGGSFSPAAGSFGLSIWITDLNGHPVATSDTIPGNLLRQRLLFAHPAGIPAIQTTSPFYQVRWSHAGRGRWSLEFIPTLGAGHRPALVLRSVGPAGGPVRSLRWDGGRLRINDRWTLIIDPQPLTVDLGEEGGEGWKSRGARGSSWADDGGWGFARFSLAGETPTRVVIEDSSLAARPPVPPASISGPNPGTHRVRVDVSDQEFVASLDAQLAHLRMGLVGRETRPGDPLAYPLESAREAALIVAALARAGHADEARGLSVGLAEKDFFGLYGAEADAPGMAIWALEEAAARLGDVEFDRWLWPHVRRKAQLIVEMLGTDRPLHRPSVGNVLPVYRTRAERTLVADAARDGLIVGRIGREWPLLYVNAVAYRGLMDAARLAERVGRPDEAAAWRSRAGALRRAWFKAYRGPNTPGGLRGLGEELRRMLVPGGPQVQSQKTYVSALWPTWIAGEEREHYLADLEQQWTSGRTVDGGFRRLPLRTADDLAEAHQWLFLERPDRVWATLRWFWEHQASAGLYTWWEQSAREGPADPRADPFHRWREVRGWAAYPHITPHYGTAAEMALLQLDMLAYAGEEAGPVLVIGAGVPAEWLSAPITVHRLPTRLGVVGWTWNGRQVRVTVQGSRPEVRLGLAFPAGTPIRLEFSPPP